MKLIAKLLLSIILYAVVFLVINLYFPQLGFSIINQSTYSYPLILLILGAAFRVTFRLIKSIISIAATPVSILTFGLSNIIINLVLLYVFTFLVRYVDSNIIVELGTIIQTLLLSVVLSMINLVIKNIL